ncbi:HEXXH motif domain-containing protein [Micromonospora sonneratiae]|uniref:HEXXH motif domain-containing protein n=1 Tax=Micromonospora sonneratiae TaxID=1184706 RepID=A0ABW3YAU5_9ACTN
MESAFHQLSGQVFTEFARGGGGVVGIRSLLAGQYSKNLLLLRAMVELSADLGHPDAGLVAQAYTTIAQTRRNSPNAARMVLNYPSVSAWAMNTTTRLTNGDLAGARPERMSAIAVATALRARMPATVVLPAATWSAKALVLPSLGRVLLPRPSGARMRLRTGGDGVTLFIPGDSEAAGRPGPASRGEVASRGEADVDGGELRLAVPDGTATPYWRPVPGLTTVHRGLRLAVRFDDLGTFSGIGATETALLDQRELEIWRRRVTAGWRLLVDRHRSFATELSAAISMIVPLRDPERGQVSGTYRNAVGCIAMSRPIDDRSAAVTLVHELQHTKLSALMNLFPLLAPGPDDRFHAPWRTDRRPLHGLLQGLYAHLGIAGFWRRQAWHENDRAHVLRAQVEFARWREACREVADLLQATGRLTQIGRRLVTVAQETLARWQGEYVPTRAVAIARRLAEQHRDRYERPGPRQEPAGR